MSAQAAIVDAFQLALIGVPNSGKTALFNRLTGSRQKVANYAGVTVERKEGVFVGPSRERSYRVLDLPGAYSLTPTTLDEAITRDLLLGRLSGEAAPRFIVCVTDATNLRLNLRLVLEIKNLGIPMIVALNMSDLARSRGYQVDAAALERELGIPVVETVAVARDGDRQLVERLEGVPLPAASPPVEWREPDLGQIEVTQREVRRILRAIGYAEPVRHRALRRIDALVMHPVAGLAILATLLFLMFQAVFSWAAVPMDMIEGSIAALGQLIQQTLPDGPLRSLLVDGIVAGIGSVLVFLPQILILFFFILLLEDSGYLPRLAVLSDRLFKRMGLNGKAFLPMVLGIGCVTMATMTTRILNSKKERLLASILLALGIPCSAQLGVILGIISGISPLATLVVFGTVGAQVFLAGHLLSRILPGKRSDFVLEIPPIRTPLWRNIFKKTTLRVKWFLREALPLFVLGTLILFTLDRLNLLSRMVRAVEPVVTGLLSLPSQTAMVFFLGFLRRDYGAAGLFDMARNNALTPVQIVVSLTVMTLFVPCVANFFVLIKEQGTRSALLITGLISVYAILVGAVLNLILNTWSLPL